MAHFQSGLDDIDRDAMKAAGFTDPIKWLNSDKKTKKIKKIQKKCDHKFIDSNHCLKCGWRP